MRVQRADLLLGDTIERILRKGKSLALLGHSGRVLAMHMGMTGSVQAIANAAAEPVIDPHVHCVWRLKRTSSTEARAPLAMLFRDPRRFGGIWPFPSLAALYDRAWARLGPDALTIEGETLRERLARTRQPIKASLLNQSLVAGVGNIYADEALFAARIHPLSRPARLNTDQWDALALAIRSIMQAAIESGGSTLRDYRDATGQPGWFAFHHHAYGRSGQPCSRCGERLRSSTVAQRTTVHCPKCQPRSSANRASKHHTRVIHNGSGGRNARSGRAGVQQAARC